jgi:hypothetical protein
MGTIKNYIFLIIISISTGVIWRMEIEWHGWHGLIWLRYFHYAIPVNFLIVLVWINFYLPINLSKRILLNLTAIIYTTLTYYIILFIIEYTMTPGPLGLMYYLSTPKWIFNILLIVPFIILGGFPVGIYLILRLFKLRSKNIYLILSIIGYLISFPIAIFLLDVFDHKGAVNDIHAIKSGLVFPFLVFSTGILILGIKTKNRDSD